MSLTRKTFTARIADLGFSMETPDNFFEPEYPKDAIDFDDPTKSAPLLLFASPVAMAFIAVAGRPAYGDGCVMQWARFLADHFQIELTTIMPGKVGGLTRWHPAIISEGCMTQNETQMQMRIVTLEDGGRLVTVHTMVPGEHQENLLPELVQCVMSFELTDSKGPTVPLVPDGPVPAVELIAK